MRQRRYKQHKYKCRENRLLVAETRIPANSQSLTFFLSFFGARFDRYNDFHLKHLQHLLADPRHGQSKPEAAWIVNTHWDTHCNRLLLGSRFNDSLNLLSAVASCLASGIRLCPIDSRK